MLGMFGETLRLKKKKKNATGRATLFNDTRLTHFRNTMKGRMKRTSSDKILPKTPADESEESVSKWVKISE